MNDAPPHHLISPTAWAVAYYRTFTDIPFSREIFAELDAVARRSAERATFDRMRSGTGERTPVFEARYKLTNRLLARSGLRQVLELAAGYSARGIALTADPGLRYVELDLAGIVEEKTAMLRRFAETGAIAPRANLHLEAGNVLDAAALARAADHFAKAPLAVINEGLLGYLSFEEKAILARNVAELLRRFGGAWITPDISLPDTGDPRRLERLRWLKALTGRSLAANRFESEEHARTFFAGFGFTAERHSFAEIAGDLVSPARLGVATGEVERLIGHRVAFVLRLAEPGRLPGAP